MSLEHVPVAPLSPERFKQILDPEQSAELDRAIERARGAFAGRVIWSVNSTARGGGVAEMLHSLIAYSRGAGVDARWVVIGGDAHFFKVTKRIHNMLHGSEGDGLGLGSEDEAVYRETAQANMRELMRLIRPDDLVLLHDPQTAGLIGPLRETGAKVVWRCHVGVDIANDTTHAAWQFLLSVRARGGRLRLLARLVHLGRPRPLAGSDHPAVDRRLLGQEPGALAVGRGVRAAGLGPPGRQPPPRDAGVSPGTTALRDASTGGRTCTAEGRSIPPSPRSCRSRAGTGSRTTPG